MSLWLQIWPSFISCLATVCEVPSSSSCGRAAKMEEKTGEERRVTGYYNHHETRTDMPSRIIAAET